MDAVDVNKEHCAIVQKRIERCSSGSVRVICDEIQSFLRTEKKKYDAVLFFASFHHLMNHYEILREIVSGHLNPGGMVILAAEPVIPDDSCTGAAGEILPYPWGCRLDGESLFQMRKRGWLELGFRESYIRSMAARLGLHVRHKMLQGVNHSGMYILSKNGGDNCEDGDEIAESYGDESREISPRRIRDAYRFFLGREPESKEAIQSHLSAKDIYALISSFMESEEFKNGIGRR